jgi:hypothetical protein
VWEGHSQNAGWESGLRHCLVLLRPLVWEGPPPWGLTLCIIFLLASKAPCNCLHKVFSRMADLTSVSFCTLRKGKLTLGVLNFQGMIGKNSGYHPLCHALKWHTRTWDLLFSYTQLISRDIHLYVFSFLFFFNFLIFIYFLKINFIWG